MPQLILFENANLQGRHKHVYRSESFLEDFNDLTSSFVILEGQWDFFIDANFDGETGGRTFGPGIYAWVGDWGVANDAISSVKLV